MNKLTVLVAMTCLASAWPAMAGTTLTAPVKIAAYGAPPTGQWPVEIGAGGICLTGPLKVVMPSGDVILELGAGAQMPDGCAKK